MILESRPMVAFDLDDCLANFIDRFVEINNRLHGKPEIGAQPIDWEWSNFGLTLQELDAAWQVVNTTQNFWETLPVQPGASPRTLKEVAKKCNVVFPTARAYSPGRSVADQSARWITRHFGIGSPAVIVGGEKGPLAAALHYDFFIDDRPKNIIEVKKASPNTKVYLKDSSHNQSFDPTVYGVQRIKTTDEFCDIVLQHSATK